MFFKKQKENKIKFKSIDIAICSLLIHTAKTDEKFDKQETKGKGKGGKQKGGKRGKKCMKSGIFYSLLSGKKNAKNGLDLVYEMIHAFSLTGSSRSQSPQDVLLF